MRYYKAEADGITVTRATESKYAFACPATGTFSGSVEGADRVAAQRRNIRRKYGHGDIPHYTIVRVTEIDAAEYRRLNKARRAR